MRCSPRSPSPVLAERLACCYHVAASGRRERETWFLGQERVNVHLSVEAFDNLSGGESSLFFVDLPAEAGGGRTRPLTLQRQAFECVPGGTLRWHPQHLCE
ncbi:unnamed protein product [Pleuronectes platessa]|uniref:Uncharacterized protein n=1 Tax=Pleuronectes platessa TaxID=8262 RepID=A0A9N7ULL8_PLEPL|nr:unnamed protein product [Pleuronectes platessa]